jgi:hypothetical protein
MRKSTNNFVQYLSLLFADWIGIISNITTFASLFLGLWDVSKLPSWLSLVPKEGYITLSYFAFIFANYRVYIRVKKDDSTFSFDIKKAENTNIETHAAILFNGSEVSFATSMVFYINIRLFATNIGSQSAVDFKIVSLSPLPFEKVEILELKLTKQGSVGILDNPYYFRPDDMTSDLQIRVKFRVELDVLETTFGALSKLKTLKCGVGATPTGKSIIVKLVECDFSQAIYDIENRIAMACQKSETSQKALLLMKRFWLGPGQAA